MLELGWFGLTNPWLLAALISLPALWWLLRIIPPAPKHIRFPAIRFLLGLEPEERTSARTPWWLLALRLCLAALLILALSGPVFNPEAELTGEGPLVLVVDDGWAAAPAWDQRLRTLERFAARAQRDNREVILVGTAPDPTAPNVRLLSATDAVRNASTWEPKPWPVDRLAVLDELQKEPLEGAEIVWLSDGVAASAADREAARSFAQELMLLGPLQVFAEPAEQRALLLLPPEIDGERLTVAGRRAGLDAPQRIAVKALGPTGEVLARATLAFEAQAARAEAQFELPLEMSNRIARLEFEPRQAVGGVVLLDERWRRRVVGLVGEPA
ncbi:MAG: BatA domain-containing protein, partial [Geminicoccaceae bacterium]